MGRLSSLQPALVVAVLALVAALAGTAIAGDTTTSAVSKKKVKKIAAKQINKLAPDLSVANAETANTANSATSAQNAASANTLDGLDSGAFLRSNVRLRIDIFPDLGPNSSASANALCQSGEKVVGGGGTVIPSGSDDRVITSAPIDANENFIESPSVEARGWRVRALNGSGTDDLYAYVLCAG